MATKRSFFIEKVRAPYYMIRNNPQIYKNIINRKYKITSVEAQKLSHIQRKIVDDLNVNGISTVPFVELFPAAEFFKLAGWVDKNEINLKQKIKKKYLYSYYGTEDKSRPIDIDNPFVQFYLSDELLQIACSYLGYIPQLFEVYIEKTVPIGENSPTYSQNWHRDPEERKTLKIFLYLNDVNLESGPFTYILGSQPTGKTKLSKLYPQKLPHGSYPNIDSVPNLIEDGNCYVAIAGKATLIFCDTAGIHKGGYATSQERIMSTAFFPSKKYSEKPLFTLEGLDHNDYAKNRLSSLGKKVLGLV
jgi:hypothetical protein